MINGLCDPVLAAVVAGNLLSRGGRTLKHAAYVSFAVQLVPFSDPRFYISSSFFFCLFFAIVFLSKENSSQLRTAMAPGRVFSVYTSGSCLLGVYFFASRLQIIYNQRGILLVPWFLNGNRGKKEAQDTTTYHTFSFR